MADKISAARKDFVNIIGRIMAHQLLATTRDERVFIAPFPEGFFISLFLRSINPLEPAAFGPRHGVVWHQQEKPQGKPQ